MHAHSPYGYTHTSYLYEHLRKVKPTYLKSYEVVITDALLSTNMMPMIQEKTSLNQEKCEHPASSQGLKSK
jgi:hypothetical protein